MDDILSVTAYIIISELIVFYQILTSEMKPALILEKIGLQGFYSLQLLSEE